ncbi:MAG: phosphate acetyltransferase [Caldiserica bacterium]|nr:phosphate acetyltransferase [Caldisericota bacterium]
MNILESIRGRAAKLHKTVVLPEGDEERNQQAAAIMVRLNMARVILVGNGASIRSHAESNGVNLAGIEVVDPSTSPKTHDYAALILEKRKAKGMTAEQAAQLAVDPIYHATCMLATGAVDALVTGAVHSTGDMLRPALQIVGTAPGNKTVSSMFLMVMPDGRLFGFGDCAIVPDPTAEQLADIAVATASTFQKLTNIEPAVAMLSFSTKGSASHEMVDKVVQATKLVRARRPDLAVDGELQFDASLVPSVARQKAPWSVVAGKANCFIFPELNAANIGYKLVQRLARAEAVGPVSQGLAKSANDLSRGCSAEDIVNVCAIALLNTQEDEQQATASCRTCAPRPS